MTVTATYTKFLTIPKRSTRRAFEDVRDSACFVPKLGIEVGTRDVNLHYSEHLGGRCLLADAPDAFAM
jgi:hypothetical protein